MIITSFSQVGYHEYGKDFITSFIENWCDEKLVVYYEKGIPSNCPKDDRIEYVDLYSVDGFEKFESLLKQSDPLFSGIMATPDGNRAYNYRFDAGKFFRKVVAITDAYFKRLVNLEKFAWIDSDVYVHRRVPDGFLSNVIHDDATITHLRREWMYSEAGFIGFNVNYNPNALQLFMTVYRDIYFSGAFKYLAEWHDCYVLDFARKALNIDCHSITVAETSMNPFDESVLGDYMRHKKGPNKGKCLNAHFYVPCEERKTA